MRAFSARFAIVVATVLAIAGCRSGGGGSPWGFGRKSAAPGMTDSGPQLPTASATPPSYGSSYSTAAQAQGTSAFAEPAGGMANQAAPYPGQPTGYSGAAAAGGMPRAAPANYAANTAIPQQGPYNENYGQLPAGSAQPYPSTGYPATVTPNGYQTAATTAPNSPPNAADPYTGVSGGGYGTPPPTGTTNAAPLAAGAYDAGSGGYQADNPSTTGGYRTADSRHGAATDPYNAQPEQAVADHYGPSSQTGDPLPPEASSSNPGEPYRPGSTGYNPGQTGYSPPGVPPYQMAAPPNVVSTTRKDPYYRPGATSDFSPTRGAQTPTASADRYNTPPIGYDRADPYAPAGGFQATSPAGGGSMTR